MKDLPEGHKVERCDQQRGRPLWWVISADGTRRGYPGTSPAEALEVWERMGETTVLWTVHKRYTDGFHTQPMPVLTRQNLTRTLRHFLTENDRKDRWICVSEHISIPGSQVPYMVAAGDRYWEIAWDKKVTWADGQPCVLPLPWEGKP